MTGALLCIQVRIEVEKHSLVTMAKKLQLCTELPQPRISKTNSTEEKDSKAPVTSFEKHDAIVQCLLLLVAQPLKVWSVYFERSLGFSLGQCYGTPFTC
jgi:hypothetical protein